MAEGVCKFCGVQGTFAKSHVVPRSFYMIDSDVPHMAVALGNVERPKKTRTGIWDEGILCRECEKKFAVWDGYAFDHLIGKKKDFAVCRDGRGRPLLNGIVPAAKYSRNADRGFLRKFAMSVLWRASVSERPEYKGVKKTFFDDKYLFS